MTLFNLPYATAVATVGSESNLLRVGARGGEPRFEDVLRVKLGLEERFVTRTIFYLFFKSP